MILYNASVTSTEGLVDRVAGMAPNVNYVIRWLSDTDLGEGELIYNPVLNPMLDEHRSTYPIAYRCSKEGCSKAIAYWALDSQGARVVPGPARRAKKRRLAGEYPTEEDPWRQQPEGTEIVGGVADLVFPDFVWEGRFDVAIEYAMKGEGNISLATNPSVGSGWPLRWTFTCPRCRSQYTHTNKQMLVMFLQAVSARQASIRAGRLW